MPAPQATNVAASRYTDAGSTPVGDGSWPVTRAAGGELPITGATCAGLDDGVGELVALALAVAEADSVGATVDDAEPRSFVSTGG